MFAETMMLNRMNKRLPDCIGVSSVRPLLNGVHESIKILYEAGKDIEILYEAGKDIERVINR
jgi:hypothetical protein